MLNFYIFFIINSLVWAIVSLYRSTLAIDAIEAILWGELVSFGTNKHPPLSGWIGAGVYNFLGHSDFVMYMLGQICVFVGAIFVYKLAKNFVSKEKALCSALILQACTYYSYSIYINSFNCNILLYALWPIVIYYFYKSIKNNKLKNWILFGLFSGLAFLGKYQIVFLFIPMLLYLLIFSREQFKKKGLYLSIAIGSLVILPHVIWLVNNDFFSFAYMLDRTHSETHNLSPVLVHISHLFYPIKFVFGQVIAIAGCIGLYLLTALQAKNISFKNQDANKQDKWFLIFVGILPIVAHGFMGVFTGSRIPSVWGSIMVSLTGILLFYFFPINFKEDTYKFFIKLSYATLLISVAVILIFMSLQTELVLSYPYKKITNDFNNIWEQETNNSELKYVGGINNYIFQFEHYHPNHPKVILETFGHKNPWIDHEDVIKSGALIISPNKESLSQFTKESVYLLPKNYEIKTNEYSFLICNKYYVCYPQYFYYTIIPPKN